jgi:hypothetical protein
MKPIRNEIWEAEGQLRASGNGCTEEAQMRSQETCTPKEVRKAIALRAKINARMFERSN